MFGRMSDEEEEQQKEEEEVAGDGYFRFREGEGDFWNSETMTDVVRSDLKEWEKKILEAKNCLLSRPPPGNCSPV